MPMPTEFVDLAVVDLGWTKQALAIPAARKWTKSEQIITLVKPHYELTNEEKTQESVGSGTLERDRTTSFYNEFAVKLLTWDYEF